MTKRDWLFCIAGALAIIFSSGCASTRSISAKPLKPVYGSSVDLSRYRIATIQRLDVPESSLEHRDPGMLFADRLAQRLGNDFGPLFDQVRMDAPLNSPDELIVGGRVTKYKPGSRVGRAFGPGITPASFEAELVLKDGATGAPVMIAPIDKLWAWGGGIGAAKGIEEMIDESSAAAANMIARSKGWTPPASSTQR